MGISQSAPVLTGTVDSQHPHVAGGVVAPGVRLDLVEHAVASGGRQLAHARMVADRPEAGLLLEPPDVSTDRRQLAPGGRSRTGLGQPATRSLKVVARFLGVDQAARHAARSAAASGRRWQLVISADTIDPGVDVIGVDIEASGEGGLGRGDAFGFPGEASFPLGLGLDVVSNGYGLGHGVNIGQCRLVL